MPTSMSVSRETLSRLPFPDEFCLIVATINGTNYLLIGECQRWPVSHPTPETITVTIHQSVAIPNGVNGEDALYYYSYYTTTNPLTDFDNVALPISNFNRTPKVGDRFTLWTRITSTNTLYYNNMRVQSVTETQATSKMTRQMAITETTQSPVYLHQLILKDSSAPSLFYINFSYLSNTNTPFTDFNSLYSDITNRFANSAQFPAFGEINQDTTLLIYFAMYSSDNPTNQYRMTNRAASQISVLDSVVSF